MYCCIYLYLCLSIVHAIYNLHPSPIATSFILRANNLLEIDVKAMSKELLELYKTIYKTETLNNKSEVKKIMYWKLCVSNFCISTFFRRCYLDLVESNKAKVNRNSCIGNQFSEMVILVNKLFIGYDLCNVFFICRCNSLRYDFALPLSKTLGTSREKIA